MYVNARVEWFLEKINMKFWKNPSIFLPSGQALEKRSSLDYATVYTGVFDPNNIAIHVAQNFVNFAAGTVAW